MDIKEHVRQCLHSQLACNKSMKQFDYQCTRGLKIKASQEADGPACDLNMGLTCPHWEKYPDSRND